MISSAKFTSKLFSSLILVAITGYSPIFLNASPSTAGNNLGLTGQNTYTFQPDPNYAGKYLWKMWVRNYSAVSPNQAVQFSAVGITGTTFDKGMPVVSFKAPRAQGYTLPDKSARFSLTDVTGVMYEKGTASAAFVAPRANCDSGTEVLTAIGRVTVTSLNPKQKGTEIQADKVTWYGKTNKGIASGNVIYHDGLSGMTIQSPRLYFDTSLKTVQSSAGYNGMLP